MMTWTTTIKKPTIIENSIKPSPKRDQFLIDIEKLILKGLDMLKNGAKAENLTFLKGYYFQLGDEIRDKARQLEVI